MYYTLLMKQEGKAEGDAGIPKRPSRTSLTSLTGHPQSTDGQDFVVEFDGVVFSYPSRPDAEVLRSFSLGVRRGEALALVGSSGCGKSTCASLIERFYDVNEGEVRLGGQDIRGLPLESLRRRVAFVGQEPRLFDCSIRDNIRFGRPDASDEDVFAASKKANCHEFVMSFPEGYDTPCGESTRLSGGQKQRVAIARALLAEPEVLLLDEPTSALDGASEVAVSQAIKSIIGSEELTVLLISHRPSTIQDCDVIAVIDKGKLVEYGSHQDLMDKQGHYARITGEETEEVGIEGTVKEQKAGDEKGDEKGDTKADEKGDEKADEKGDDKEDVASKMTPEEYKSFKRELLGLFEANDRKWMFLCLVGAILAGLVFPFWGATFSVMINLLFRIVYICDDANINQPRFPDYPSGLGQFGTCANYYEQQSDDMESDSHTVLGYWAGLGGCSLIGYTLLIGAGTKISENLSKRVRDRMFKKLLSLEPAYHDINPVGDSATQLAEDTTRLKDFSLAPVTSLLLSLASILVGLGLALAYMWPIALIALGCIPLLLFATKVEMEMTLGLDTAKDEKDEEGVLKAGNVLSESLTNIRVVYALEIQEKLHMDFMSASRVKGKCKKNMLSGITAGSSMFIQQAVNALQFWAGGQLLRTYPDSFTFEGFLISMFALLFALFGLGAAVAGFAGIAKAKVSAIRVLKLLNTESKIDSLGEPPISYDARPRGKKKEIEDRGAEDVAENV